MTIPDTTPPVVTSTTPVSNAVGVSLAQVVSATFSKPMNPSTISGTTFTLTGPGAVAVAGTVAYTSTGSVATFTPSASLSPGTLYTATITTGAQDTATPANALAANYVWSFTTVVVPPTVISTIPLSGATGVPLTQVISATFSKAMNPATLTNTTFTLSAGGVAIAGTVSYTGTTASFTPAVSLASNTVFTATITTGAQDVAGDALAANYVWTFTTVVVPPTVVSTIPLNGATAVPVAQVISATFSKAMNAATLTNTTFTVSAGGVAVAGTVSYAGTTASFTPSATLASDTVFTATITTGAQDVAGDALAANYVWTFTTVVVPPTVISTIPLNGATGVPLAQAISATFSKAMNAATLNAATFTLSSGGVAVAGTVTYTGTTATFTPSANLLPNVLYTATITTGAQDVAGEALAANYVWTFTTVVVPPTVVSTIPLNGATGVPLAQAISATFSKAMNPATLNNATFTLTAGGAAVAGTVTYTGTTATLTPSENLTANTLYTATITTGAQDVAGDALAANYVWMFRSIPAPAPPTVTATNPANNATAVGLNQAISATFNEAVDPATLTTTTFTVSGGGAAVTGTVSYVVAGSVVTFTPTAALAANTVYTATITTGVTDLLGTPLAANYVWTFTTGAAPDTTPPTVTATVPLSNATNVPLTQVITATFSEALNPVTVSSATFTLTGPGATAVPGLVAYAAVGDSATFTPIAPLVEGTLYTATITTGVTDLAGNALAVNYVWSFTTGVTVVTNPPTIVLTSPISGATGVALNATVSATFSEAMNPLTLTNTTFELTAGATTVAATVSYDAVNFIATLTPTALLTAGTTYTATVTPGATDLTGDALVAGTLPNPWTFTTGTVVIPPVVNLGTSSLFGGYGGAGITNQGTETVINGNLATTGVSTTITGFHDTTAGCIYTETPLNIGLVNGTIDTAPPPPTVACPTEGTAITSAIAAQGAADALTAYNQLAAIPGGLDVSVCPGCGGGAAGELGNRTLAPGTYKSAPGSYTISQGDLVLDAKGDANASWVFQMATSLDVGTPASNRNVLLINGAQAKNVFWQVGSAATINGILGGGTFTGTVIAQAGVSVSTAGIVAITTINGRAMALNGPVTVVNTVINVPAP